MFMKKSYGSCGDYGNFYVGSNVFVGTVKPGIYAEIFGIWITEVTVVLSEITFVYHIVNFESTALA